MTHAEEKARQDLRDEDMTCPECNTQLTSGIFYDENGISDEGVVCPNGCDLYAHYC